MLTGPNIQPTEEPSSGDPLYQRLAVQLIAEIETERYPEGSLLPTEQDLASRYKVSRQTVRAAVGLLRVRGLVESRRGVGTRVVSRTSALTQTFSAASVDDLIALVRRTELEIVNRARVRLPASMSSRFDAEAGATWLYFGCRRRDVGDGSILAWTDTYIDSRYEAVLLDGERRLATPLFERIEAAAKKPTRRIRQEIRAVILKQAMAGRLNATAGEPALQITRSYSFEDGRPFEVAINTLPASRFHYTIDLLSDGRIQPRPHIG